MPAAYGAGRQAGRQAISVKDPPFFTRSVNLRMYFTHLPPGFSSLVVEHSRNKGVFWLLELKDILQSLNSYNFCFHTIDCACPKQTKSSYQDNRPDSWQSRPNTQTWYLLNGFSLQRTRFKPIIFSYWSSLLREMLISDR